MPPTPSPFDIPVTTLDGEPTTLADHRGEVLLIVNVASKCGFTPQYVGLEELYKKFAGRGFSVLGFPCNQFGGQEPGDGAAIREFCSTKFHVTFPMYGKVEVNGVNAHPLYKLLKDAARGTFGTQSVKWNFTKFLVDRAGNVVGRYGTATRPRKLAAAIEELLVTSSPTA
jgi:glutathione peroxidase